MPNQSCNLTGINGGVSKQFIGRRVRLNVNIATSNI